MSAARRIAATVLPLLLAAAAPLRADDNRPLYIELSEAAPHEYTVAWRVPANVEPRHLPELHAPGECRVAPRIRQWSEPLGHWREAHWSCTGGLAGRSVSIVYPFANPNLATIARVRQRGGEPQTVVLMPQEIRLVVPAGRDDAGGLIHYVELGFRHIWGGVDHLLFVAGLIFVAGSVRRILAAITGFTIAHSITLALAALDLVRLPPSAVESVIALSIVFLAVEVVKGPRDTLTWRRPIAVAGSFGLLHGFGFAAALRQLGLPEGGLLTALFGFNLGIEIGQALFASLLIAAFAVAHRYASRTALGARTPLLAGYGIGCLASYWAIARLAG